MANDLQIVNFAVGEVDYGVPVHQVREILGMQVITPVPGTSHYNLGIANLRGQVITVLDLKLLLGLQGSLDANRKIIWVQHQSHMVGIVVDSVTEVTTVAGEEIEETSDATSSVNSSMIGVGKQKDRLVVLVDFVKLVETHQGEMLVKERGVAH